MMQANQNSKKLRAALEAALPTPDKDGLEKMESVVEYDGIKFQFSLNPQSPKSNYYLRGTVRVLDRSGRTLKRRGKGKVYAREEVCIPRAKDSASLRELVIEHLAKAIHRLANANRGTLQQKAANELDPRSSTLGELLFAFEERYRAQNGKQPSKDHSLYKLRTLADRLPDTKLERISQGKLCAALPDGSGETRLQCLRALEQFLSFVERKTTVPRLMPFLPELIKAERRHSKDAVSKRSIKKAANAPSLPERVEHLLNERILDSLTSDPNYLAMALLKGSGLCMDDLLGLRMGDLERNGTDRRIVFVHLRKEYSNSATQNYTFPLFPLEAVMVNRYLDALAEQSPERVQPERYLLSSNEDGTAMLDAAALRKFVKNTLTDYKIGYGGLLQGSDLSREHGVELLRATFRARLEAQCNLTVQTDEGALTFLCHRSLASLIQSDHYRSFTDEGGRSHLLGILMRDQRDVPQKKGLRSVLTQTIDEYTRTTRRLPDPAHDQRVELLLTPSADGIIRITAPYGARFLIEELPNEEETPSKPPLD